jgi:hypothetical protein
MINSTPGYLSNQTDFTTLFTYKLRNFVDGVMKGTALKAPAEAGMMVQKMLDGVYRSADAGGKEVKID